MDSKVPAWCGFRRFGRHFDVWVHLVAAVGKPIVMPLFTRLDVVSVACLKRAPDVLDPEVWLASSKAMPYLFHTMSMLQVLSVLGCISRP